MKTYSNHIKLLILVVMSLIPCAKVMAADKTPCDKRLVAMAIETLDSTRHYLATSDKSLLMEQYPRQPKDNKCSYLWGYSATVSSVSALYSATCDKKWLKFMDKIMLRGLDKYYDNKRKPAAYASYLNVDDPSDRFYDDNIWLGIDMADMYAETGNKKYLKRAEEIWKFIMSGYDDVLGGGVYWCEQKKVGKNTCSNAPASVYALKMYNVTGDKQYLKVGTDIYNWTKKTLEDTSDHNYYDNISLRGKIGKDKYSYNTGQMLQAAAMLYKITGEKTYLEQAGQMAEACYNEFFEAKGETDTLRQLKGGLMWFDAVMIRGFIELYRIDGNRKYVDACKASVFTAWDRARSQEGLFSGQYDRVKEIKTLLNQAAMVEIMARLSTL